VRVCSCPLCIINRLCKSPSSLYYPRPFALPTLLQYYCTTFVQYMNSPRPSIRVLALTQYCYYQYCIMYSIHTGGGRGSCILSNERAMVLYQGRQCRWAGGMKGWVIRAQQSQSKRISCKGQFVCHAPYTIGNDNIV